MDSIDQIVSAMGQQPPKNYGVGSMKRPSERKEQRIIDAFHRHLDAAKTMKSNVEDMALKAMRQFCAVVPGNSKIPYYIRVHDPHFYATVLALAAGYASQILGAPSFVSYIAKGGTSDETASHFTAAADYHIRQDARFRLEILEIILNQILFGNGFGCIFWNEEYRKVGRWENVEIPNFIPSVDEFGNLTMLPQPIVTKEFVTGEKRVKNSPWFRTIPFWNCYPDAEAKCVSEGRWFIYRERRPLSYVKAMSRSRQWFRSAVREVLENPHHYATDDYHDISRSIRSHGAMTPDPGVDMDDPMVDVDEYMTPDGVATIVGGKIVVAYREGYTTGYYPIVHVRNTIVPGSFWGMSALQPVETLVGALQHMASAQLTESVMQVFKPIIVSDPTVNIDRFNYGPGQILKVANGNANAVSVFPHDPSGIQVSQAMSTYAQSRIDVALGSSDTRRGTLPRSSTLATAVQASEQNAQLRTGPNVVELEDSLVRQIGRQFAALIMCCQDEAITTRLKDGGKVVTLYPELLNGNFELEVQVQAGMAQMAELETKRMLEFGNVAMNHQVGTFNREEWAKILAESIIPRCADRVIMDQEEAAQQAMMQQQLAMLSGRGPGVGPGPGAQPNGSPTEQGGAISTGDGAQDMGGVTELSREIGGEQRID